MQHLLSYLQRSWRDHLGTLLLVLVVVFAVQAWQTRDVPAGPAPDLVFTLIHPDGSQTESTLSAWRAQHPDQPVALYVWAEWCPICRVQEPSITRLARDWPVLTVAMQSGSPAAVRRVLTQRQLPWPTANDPRGDLADLLGFQSVPAFVVVDGQGHLRSATVGYTSGIGMRLRLWWAKLI